MNTSDTEMLRHAVLEALATRYPNAATVGAIRRSVAVSLPFSPEDDAISGALVFLKDQGLTTMDHDPMGSTQWWRITANGLLAVERHA